MTIADWLATSITAVFLLIVLSYYVLIFLRVKKPDYHKKFASVSIIIPARNEAKYIAACIQSVQDAAFDGKKQVIVIDDGSKDNTAAIVRSMKGVVFLQNKKHTGKSASLNKALKHAKGDLVAIVDGDSTIQPDALVELAKELSRKDVAGAAAVVRVKNRLKFINIWVHIELLYASLLRSIFTKIHANVTTPGALSMYRRTALLEVGGFNTQGFSEDLDICVRMIRKGYRIGFSDTAISDTNMPDEVKGWFRQRTRLARGMIHFLKQHLQLNTTMIDVYTLPLFLFTYMQAIIMGCIILWQIGSGYWTYYASQDVWMSWGVAKFLFEWFSIVGTAKWMWSIVTTGAWTVGNAVGVVSSLLTYPLFALAIIRYDKRIDHWHLIPLFFMFPYWFLIMMVALICTPEVFARQQYNRWKKNE